MSKLKSVLKDTLTQIQQAELPRTASSLAYTTILSVIPLIAVSFSIFKLFGGMDKLYGAIEPFIFENLAEGSDEATLNAIRGFIGNIHAGTLGFTGFLGLIVTSMLMLSSIEIAVNRVWKVELKRSLYQRVTGYWMIISGGPILLAAIVGAATSGKVPLAKLVPSGFATFVLLFAIFTLIYKYVPHRIVHWVPAVISGLVTACVFITAKAGYGVYVRKVVTYNKIYGSVAAIPIFLVWIYVGWLVALGGAALSAAIQKRYDTV